MKVDIQPLGTNEKKVELTLETADIAPEIKAKLNKIRSTTDIKGFRKGKTPMSFVRRVYGKQVALEVISDMAMKSINELVEENKFDLINQPLLTASSVPAVEGGGLDDACEFTYVLGLMPDIELSGLSKEDTYDYLELDVDNEKIEESLGRLRKQMGTQQEADDVVETDILEVDVAELDGDALKEGGHTANFRFAVDLVADDALKAKLLTLGPDESFDFDIYNLEQDRPEEYVKQYFLQVGEDVDVSDMNSTFRATIKAVHRHVDAEMNDEFFEKAFPNLEVKNLEDAQKEIEKQYVAGYASVGDNLLIKEIIERTTDSNTFDLPTQYIEEVLKSNNQEITDEAREEMADSVRRQIIVSMMIKKFDIQVEYDDLRQRVLSEFSANFGGMGMLGGLPPETLDKIVNNAMQDEKYVRELSDRVLNDKLISAAKANVALNVQKKEEEALMKIYDEAFPRPTPAEEEE